MSFQIRITSGATRTVQYMVGVPEVRTAGDKWAEVVWNEVGSSGAIRPGEACAVVMKIPPEASLQEWRIPLVYCQFPTRIEGLINRAASSLKLQRTPFLWEAKTIYFRDFPVYAIAPAAGGQPGHSKPNGTREMKSGAPQVEVRL
jgi:hypothetical protein